MKRRTFIGGSMASLGLTATCQRVAGAATTKAPKRQNVSFSIDGNIVRFYSDAVTKPIRLLVVADTHLFRDDERGGPYREFSARMAAAYHETKHFVTGAPTNPETSFVEILDQAEKRDVDLLALVGDIFSFPSEAAIDWVGEKLSDSDLRYLYVAGNHDWHYEGMPGSLGELRSTWIDKRLKPLYQGNHPLMAHYDVGEVRVLAIDNSHYEILPEQLEYFRNQLKCGKPLILTLHIPLFAPGRPMGFGCGHPKWGALSDRNFELERRPKWPEAGHTTATMDFHHAVFNATNLLGVFAGHTHRDSVDVVGGIPQFVTDVNASGGFLTVEVLPQV